MSQEEKGSGRLQVKVLEDCGRGRGKKGRLAKCTHPAVSLLLVAYDTVTFSGAILNTGANRHPADTHREGDQRYV